METGEQEELIDLQCDEGALEKFKDFILANFWLNVSFPYPTLIMIVNQTRKGKHQTRVSLSLELFSVPYILILIPHLCTYLFKCAKMRN